MEGWAAIIIALSTFISGLVALKFKADKERVEQIDTAHTHSVCAIQRYANMLQERLNVMELREAEQIKQILAVQSRESDMRASIAVLQHEVKDCHDERASVIQQLEAIRQKA